MPIKIRVLPKVLLGTRNRKVGDCDAKSRTGLLWIKLQPALYFEKIEVELQTSRFSTLFGFSSNKYDNYLPRRVVLLDLLFSRRMQLVCGLNCHAQKKPHCKTQPFRKKEIL